MACYTLYVELLCGGSVQERNLKNNISIFVEYIKIYFNGQRISLVRK